MEGTPTPSSETPVSAPQEASAPAEAAPDSAITQPETPEVSQEALAALKRKVSSATRNRQQVMEAQRRAQELEGRVKELEPLRELQELAKSNPAEAARKLLGDRLLDAYTGVTPDVLGLQQEAADVDALPKPVREQLAKVRELEAKLAALEPVVGKVEGIEKQRLAAEEAIQAQHVEAQTRALYESGFKAVEADPSVLGPIAKAPNRDALVAAEWQALIEERATAGLLKSPDDAIPLVAEAAKRAAEKFKSQFEWLLTASGDSGKNGHKSHNGARRTGNSTDAHGENANSRASMRDRLAALRQEIGSGQGQPPAEIPETPAPSSKARPRTVAPGSLGTAAPTGKLSWRERAALLKKEL